MVNTSAPKEEAKRPFNEAYQLEAKSNTHSKYLDLISVLRDDLLTKTIKQEMMDYFVPRIIEAQRKARMRDVKGFKALTDVDAIAYKLGSFLNFALNNSINLTRVASMLGRSVMMGKMSNKLSKRVRNLTEVRVGLELLDIPRADKKITYRRETIQVSPDMTDQEIKKQRGRAPYRIKELDQAFIFKLAIAFYYPEKDRPVYTQPLLNEPSDWKEFYHDIMGEMVRHTVDGVPDKFSLYKTPKVFEFMNKIKKTSFVVNTKLLEIFEQCLNDPLFTHEGSKYKPVQLKSILEQQREIFRIARSTSNQVFWLASFLDFRGRFYYANTYFHPQGNKLARSLIKFEAEKRIKESGWKALLMAATSEYGHSKFSRKKKISFAVGALPKWLKWAENPLEMREKWQAAKNPFAFLSIILEIKAAVDSGDKFNYESNLPIYIDASNSGTQILSALGKDPIGGALSNLVKANKVGDVYATVAGKVWKKYNYTAKERKLYDKITVKILEYKDKMDAAYNKQKWDKFKAIKEEYKEYYNANKEDIKTCAKVFWKEQEEHRRDICKRPVMTIPYSAGVRTIARSLLNDWSPKKHMDGITGTYCFELSRSITEEYKNTLKIPTILMELFITLGHRARNNGKDLEFLTPEIRFPFIQNARKDKFETVTFKRRGQRFRLKVCVGEDTSVDYTRVGSASSPNSIHALDAAFMMMIVLNATYPMIAIHDSFATYPGAHKKLDKDVRKVFVEMFSKDVLKDILTQCGSMDLYDTIEKGDLDITGVFDNDYAFDT